VVIAMYQSQEHVRERQRAMLDTAVERGNAQRLRKVNKVTRRAERVEREVSRGWCEAARLRAELSQLAADPRY
jgi:hypothetical protein